MNRLLTVIGFLLIVGAAATTVWLTQSDNPEAPSASTARDNTTSVEPAATLPLATSYMGSDENTVIAWDPELGDQFIELSCAGACGMVYVTGERKPITHQAGLAYVPAGTETVEVFFVGGIDAEWMIDLTDGT